MTFGRVLSAVLVPICWVFVVVASDAPKATAGSTAGLKPAVTNSSGGNNTHSGGESHGKISNGSNLDSSMIQRALYVLIAITTAGVLYFLIRAVRLKKPTQKKKYGLLSNYDDSVEMEVVESDEDDTLYEARSLRR